VLLSSHRAPVLVQLDHANAPVGAAHDAARASCIRNVWAPTPCPDGHGVLWIGLVQRVSVAGDGSTHAGAQRFCVVALSVYVAAPMGSGHAHVRVDVSVMPFGVNGDWPSI